MCMQSNPILFTLTHNIHTTPKPELKQTSSPWNYCASFQRSINWHRDKNIWRVNAKLSPRVEKKPKRSSRMCLDFCTESRYLRFVNDRLPKQFQRNLWNWHLWYPRIVSCVDVDVAKVQTKPYKESLFRDAGQDVRYASLLWFLCCFCCWQDRRQEEGRRSKELWRVEVPWVNTALQCSTSIKTSQTLWVVWWSSVVIIPLTKWMRTFLFASPFSVDAVVPMHT